MQTNKAEIESIVALNKRMFLADILKPGETYAGILLGENGAPDVHLIVMDGEVTDVSWDKSMKWAAGIGGALPTRREQRLLFANAKSAFQARWYWSNTQHEDYPANAWGQYFFVGSQNYGHKSFTGHARAVRRLPI